jgi:hypothetical protein
MRILTVHDLGQYDHVLIPLDDELAARGHSVVHSGVEKGIRATVVIQTPSGAKNAAGEVFWLSHGVSCTKYWSVPRWLSSGPDGKASASNGEPWTGTHYLAPGPYWMEMLEKEPGTFLYHLTGWSKTDVLVRLNEDREGVRERVYAKMRYDPDRKLVAYFPTYVGGGHGRRMVVDPEVVAGMFRDRYNVAVFGHQMERQEACDMFRACKDVVHESGLFRLEAFAAADLVIGDTSSMMYESCVFDRSIVLLDNPEDPAYFHLRHCVDNPVVDMGPRVLLADLRDAVDYYVGHPKDFELRRRYWRDYVLGPTDGKCCERIAAVIESSTGDVGEKVNTKPVVHETEVAKHQGMAKDFVESIGPYPGGFEGRGIVMCVGGVRCFTCAWVCVNMLRRAGCGLPIQYWYMGPVEIDSAMRELVKPLGVECVDAFEVRKAHPVKRLAGWELKPYALTWSPFKEVILIDSDNVPLVDPSFLFDDPRYKAAGALFWPDYNYQRLKADNPIWQACGVDYRDEPAFESGQMVVDKERCWRELNLTMHLNEESKFYYRFVYGDKDTWHMAWRMLGTEYAMVPHGIKALKGTMCQHDLDGRRIFQHRNTAKWRLFEDNPRIEGFEQEDACLGFIEDLKTKWKGDILARKARTDAGMDVERSIMEARMFQYNRVGHDIREMELLPEGRIGKGAAGNERHWFVDDAVGVPELCIAGNRNVICRLRLEGGVWKGRWLAYERMPIEMTPIVKEGVSL